MRTIGKRTPRPKKTGGDFRTFCAECRAPDHRSKLKMYDDGQLRHPRCWKGPTVQGLNRLNADRARASVLSRGPIDGPGYQSVGQPYPALGQLTNPVVGWVWFNVSDGSRFDGSPNVTVRKISTGNFQFVLTDGAEYHTVQPMHLEPGPALEGLPILYFVAGKSGPSAAQLAVRNRFGDTTPAHGDISLCRVLVLLYGDSGTRMLGQTAWATIAPATGAVVEQEGGVTCTRTAAGRHTITTAGTFRVAVVAKPSFDNPRAGIAGSNTVKLVLEDNTLFPEEFPNFTVRLLA